MVKIVLILFVIEASEEIIAAINAAKVNPNKPFGNSDIIIGYAWSDLSREGKMTAAQIPGNTTTKGINNFKYAANITPFCASGNDFAARALCVMYWLKPQ